MPVEIDGVEISSWTPVITRGGAFIHQLSFLDDDGDPIALLDAEFIVEPNGSASITWSSADGRFTNVSPGVYLLNLEEAYTPTLSWDSGRYHISIVDPSGITDPCITEGTIFVEDC